MSRILLNGSFGWHNHWAMMSDIWLFRSIHAKLDQLRQFMWNNPRVDMYSQPTTTEHIEYVTTHESARRSAWDTHSPRHKYLHIWRQRWNARVSWLFFLTLFAFLCCGPASLEIWKLSRKLFTEKKIIKLKIMTKTIVCKLAFMWNTLSKLYHAWNKKFRTKLCHIQHRPDLMFFRLVFVSWKKKNRQTIRCIPRRERTYSFCAKTAVFGTAKRNGKPDEPKRKMASSRHNRAIKQYYKRNHKFWPAFARRTTPCRCDTWIVFYIFHESAISFFSFVRYFYLTTQKTKKKKQGQPVPVWSMAVSSVGVCRSHVIKCVKRKQPNKRTRQKKKTNYMRKQKQQRRGHSSHRPRRMLISFFGYFVILSLFAAFGQGHSGRKEATHLTQK